MQFTMGRLRTAPTANAALQGPPRSTRAHSAGLQYGGADAAVDEDALQRLIETLGTVCVSQLK